MHIRQITEERLDSEKETFGKVQLNELLDEANK